jgi:hypothetical protein
MHLLVLAFNPLFEIISMHLEVFEIVKYCAVRRIRFCANTVRGGKLNCIRRQLQMVHNHP